METINVNEVAERALATVAKDFARRVSEVKERAEQYENFITAIPEDAAELRAKIKITSWGVQYGDSFSVTLSMLPAIRKVVGRLTMVSKSLAWDFKTSNELTVILKPTAEKFSHLRFTYRTPFRRGGKCHVETIVSTSETLVCKR